MKWLTFPYIIWMIGFIILPLIMLIMDNTKTGDLPENILLINDPINRKALILALQLSLISTIICLLLAYPLAMILSNAKMSSNNLLY